MPQIYGLVQSLPPAAGADGTQKQIRVDPFGAVHTRSEVLAFAEGGEYFRACNPTPGTGISMGVQTAFSDTANVLLLMRNGSASKIVIPHYIRLLCTAAGTGATSSHLAIVADTGNRYSTGGTDLLASAYNCRSDQSPTPAVDVLRFGAVTALAAVARRILSRAALKTQAAPCWVVGDEIQISFAAFGETQSGAKSGSSPNAIPIAAGPIILGAQNHCLLLHVWNPASSGAPSFEVEVAWWERGK